MNFSVMKILGVLTAALPLFIAGSVIAAEIRTLPLDTVANPGDVIPMWVEILTQPGDNTVGYGYYAFAADLSLSGSLALPGSAISSVVINTTVFNDPGGASTGQPSGNKYVGTGAATLDFVKPNPGANVGDIIRLFDFNLTIPMGTPPGSTIIVTPSEGANEFVTLNPNFDRVSPQSFTAASLVVIPEPATIGLLSLVILTKRRKRKRVQLS